jgi:hypothetical protein
MAAVWRARVLFSLDKTEAQQIGSRLLMKRAFIILQLIGTLFGAVLGLPLLIGNWVPEIISDRNVRTRVWLSFSHLLLA